MALARDSNEFGRALSKNAGHEERLRVTESVALGTKSGMRSTWQKSVRMRSEANRVGDGTCAAVNACGHRTVDSVRVVRRWRPRRGGGGHIGSRPRDEFIVRLLENGRPRRDQGVDMRDAQLVDHQRAVAWRHSRWCRARIYWWSCMRRMRVWRRLLRVVSRGVETLSHHGPCSASSASGGLSRSSRPVSSTSLYTCNHGRCHRGSPVMASAGQGMSWLIAPPTED